MIAAEPCDCLVPMPTSTSWWWLWIFGVTAFLILGSVVAALVHRRRTATVEDEPGDSRNESRSDSIC